MELPHPRQNNHHLSFLAKGAARTDVVVLVISEKRYRHTNNVIHQQEKEARGKKLPRTISSSCFASHQFRKVEFIFGRRIPLSIFLILSEWDLCPFP